jgi:hypothetical protein
MFDPRDMQPTRGHRRQWRRQQDQYQRRGYEFEPPCHVLNDTTGAVPALDVTEVTAACRLIHRPTSRAGDEPYVVEARDNGEMAFTVGVVGPNCSSRVRSSARPQTCPSIAPD